MPAESLRVLSVFVSEQPKKRPKQEINTDDGRVRKTLSDPN